MNKNKYYLVTGLIGLLVTTAAVASISSASFGEKYEKKEMHNQEMTEKKTMQMENRGEMKSVFENNDYNTWAEMMNEKVDSFCLKAEEMRGNITEENFDKMVQAHQLIQNGEKDEAMALMKEAGFGGDGYGYGSGLKGGIMMNGHWK